MAFYEKKLQKMSCSQPKAKSDSFTETDQPTRHFKNRLSGKQSSQSGNDFPMEKGVREPSRHILI